MEQGRTPEVQGRSRYAQRPATSEHSAILQLLGGGVAQGQKSYSACDRAHDVRDTQNVRVTYCINYVTNTGPLLNMYTFTQQLFGCQ